MIDHTIAALGSIAEGSRLLARDEEHISGYLPNLTKPSRLLGSLLFAIRLFQMAAMPPCGRVMRSSSPPICAAAPSLE